VTLPGGVPFIDTHAHLDDPVFDSDRDQVLASSRAVGVGHLINIGFSPERWTSSCRLRNSFAGVEIAIGLHPQLAADFNEELRKQLEFAVEDLRPIAIGETGFDYSRRGPAPEAQERAFLAQLELAASAKLPVIIHQRDAADALMTTLDRWHASSPIVLHSFDGDERLVAWAIERGCYVGIGGLATKPSSAPLRQFLSAVPRDRLLLETDAPYLPPPGAERRNSPANLPAIAEILAPLWELFGPELGRITADNASRLFGLDTCDREAPERET
jgi:TatD DNase family protein